MASEKYIAKFDEQLWSQCGPILSKMYQANFRSVLATTASRHQFAKKLMHRERPALNDLVAEISFAHAAKSHDLRLRNDDRNIIHCAIERINLVSGKQLKPDNVSIATLRDSINLSHRLNQFLEQIAAVEINFHPRLRGYGFLNSCSPDILATQTLIEVKTSAYGFRLEDFRQLFLYQFLAFQNDFHLDRLILVNPRLGYGIFLPAVEFYERVTRKSHQRGMDDLARYLTTQRD